MSAQHTPGRHTVKAAAIGPLFRKPDAYTVEISVERWRSQWAIRCEANGFATFRRPFRTKAKAVVASDELAAETTRLNEAARAAIAKATGAATGEQR